MAAQASARIDASCRSHDTGAMGVRTRGLDIEAGAAKLKADRAARLEAELVVDRPNWRLATGRDMVPAPAAWMSLPRAGAERRGFGQGRAKTGAGWVTAVG
jgi:hypothetical protein